MTSFFLAPIRWARTRLLAPVWRRFYPQISRRFPGLYQNAKLRFAPGVTMELIPGDVLSNRVALTGVHESSLSRRVVSIGRKGGTMIDIGANLGYFSLLWAASNRNNRCISFEASPRNVELLRRNVSRNGFDEQIKVVPLAAGAAPGKLSFDLGPADQRGWGGLTLNAGEGTIEVTVVRVDEIVGSNDRIQFMKVDTEGADAWALIGSEKLLKAGLVEEIWFEENKERCAALSIPARAAVDFLQSVGYHCSPLGDPDAGLVEWRAMRKE